MDPLDGPKEACKTYLEQTKLLVTLASAFVVAPAATIPLFVGKDRLQATTAMLSCFLGAEMFFVFSVLSGYLVLGTIAGSQQANQFDVYRPATMFLSRAQIFCYLAGLGLFVAFLRLVMQAKPG
jgi:hypothetical protein